MPNSLEQRLAILAKANEDLRALADKLTLEIKARDDAIQLALFEYRNDAQAIGVISKLAEFTIHNRAVSEL
jgi:hypothetical protein